MDAHSVFEPDESGRVLDRLAGLEQVISPELIEQALLETETKNKRRCKAPHVTMLWVVLAMGLFTGEPIEQVFKLCRRFHRKENTPRRSTLCTGRKRLGTASIRRLFALAALTMGEEHIPGCFYKGLRLMAIDGSVYNVPDTPANERAFGRPRGGSCSTSRGAFPQVGKLALVEIGTRAEVGIVIRPITVSEQKLAPRLCAYITPEMLTLLDCGFYGYPLLHALFATGGQVLCRVPATPKLTPIQQLSDGSYLARIGPAKGSNRYREQHGIVVRVIKYTIDDPQRTGHQEVHRLLTTLLDEQEHPAAELIALYHERWEQETGYDEQKTHQDPRRASKPTHLRSQTPAGVVQELYGLSLAHYAVCKVKFDAAVFTGVDPDRISFTGTIQVLRCRLPECSTQTPQTIDDWYENLVSEVARQKLPPRANRINPRTVRTNRKKWNMKKPDDYDRPPLTKTFPETIVILS